MRKIHNNIKHLIKAVLDGTVDTSEQRVAHKIFKKAITIVIFVNIVSILASTFEELNDYNTLFVSISYISSIIFTVEYILRVFSAPGDKTQKKAATLRLRYIFSFMGLVDFITILPYAIQFTGVSASEYAHITEFTKIFVTLKLLRYSTTFSFILDVFYSVRREMIFATIIALSVVIVSGLMMYQIEKDAQPAVFSNAGDGLWWSIITFTTVGYGDVRPITELGRIVAGIIAFAGIGILALPAGIISSAFIKRVNSLKNPDNNIPIKALDILEPKFNHSENHDNINSHEQKHDNNYCPHCGTKLNNNDN